MQTRRGLEIIIDAAASLFDQRSLQRLAEGVLTQLSSLMAVECAGILVLRETGVRRFKVLAGSGVYKRLRRPPSGSDEVEDELRRADPQGLRQRAATISPSAATFSTWAPAAAASWSR